MEQVSQATPDTRVLNVTHGRNLRLIDAWAKAGMPEDKSIDTGEMTKDGEWSKPGQVFRLTTAGLEAVEKPERPGIYFARHGETDFQGKGSGEPSAVADQSKPRPRPPAHVAPGTVHEEIAPYSAKSTNDFAGQARDGLAWVRSEPGSFANGAVPHPQLPGGIGLLHGERGEHGFGVVHIDEARKGPEYLDEAIEKIPSLPVVETITDKKTGRELGKVLWDGKYRANSFS